MTNHLLQLSRRIILILVCLCISQSLLYSQSASRAVVKLRSSIDLKRVEISSFSPVSKLLAVWREDGTVQVIDISDGRERAALSLPNKKRVAMHWAPDGLRLLINNQKFSAIWDARAGDKLSTLPGLQQKEYLNADHVKWSPSGTTILSLHYDSSIKASILDAQKTVVRLWNASSGQMKFQVKIKETVGEAQFSSDGKLLLTSSWYEDARLWEVETGRLLATFTPPERPLREGSSGAISPDGKFVAVHRHGAGIYLWDAVSGLLKTTVALDSFGEDAYALLGFSPDGKVLAIYREHLKGFKLITSIELRDGATGELRATLTGKNMRNAAGQVAWSSDGQAFITGGGGKYEGKIWEVGTGRLKGTFPMLLTYERTPFLFGIDNLDRLSVHLTLPIVSAVNDKFVRMWSLETGELLQRIDNAGRAEWTTDGKLLLTFQKGLEVAQIWEVVLQPVETSIKLPT